MFTILLHVFTIYYIWIVGMYIKPPSPYEIKNKYLYILWVCLQDGVQEYASLFQPTKRKGNKWIHNNVPWMDKVDKIKYN